MNRVCVLIAGSGKIAAELIRSSHLDFDCVLVVGSVKKSAAELHAELYELRPGPDPVDMLLVREKKKKLPWRKRKFCRHY